VAKVLDELAPRGRHARSRTHPWRPRPSPAIASAPKDAPSRTS
jgi:hypothetical protein